MKQSGEEWREMKPNDVIGTEMERRRRKWNGMERWEMKCRGGKSHGVEGKEMSGVEWREMKWNGVVWK